MATYTLEEMYSYSGEYRRAKIEFDNRKNILNRFIVWKGSDEGWVYPTYCISLSEAITQRDMFCEQRRQEGK